MTDRRDTRNVWRTPILLGLISAVGLVTALLSDAWGDWISWATLGAVCAAGSVICIRGFSPSETVERQAPGGASSKKAR